MTFLQSFLQKCDGLIAVGCVTHDIVSDFIAAHLKSIKTALLIGAHMSLFGVLFPELAKSFGSLAQIVLFVIVLSSPFAKLFRMKLLYQIVGLRRELGIIFAYLAIVHGLGYILNPVWFDQFIAPFTSSPLSMLPRYLFGCIALFLTLPLLITSNTISVRLLKLNWKRVHLLTYPMFAAMLLHTMLPRQIGRDSAAFGWAQFAVVFGGYIFLKALARYNFIVPLRVSIEYVGNYYTRYRQQKIVRNDTSSASIKP